jgi:hypothetical protein
MVYLIFNVIAASFSLAIIRNKDIFFSCLARIEALFIVFLISMLTLAKTVDKFSAVFSVSAKSLFWRNIYYFSS